MVEELVVRFGVLLWLLFFAFSLTASSTDARSRLFLSVAYFPLVFVKAKFFQGSDCLSNKWLGIQHCFGWVDEACKFWRDVSSHIAYVFLPNSLVLVGKQMGSDGSQEKLFWKDVGYLWPRIFLGFA